MPDPTRILIVDGQAVFREALAYSLAQEFVITGHCGNTTDAIRALSTEPADVILLDGDLHGEVAGSLLSWAEAEKFRGRFLIMTAGLSSAEAIGLIQRGVAGIFLKELPLSDLTAAIRTIAGGGNWLEQRFLKLILDVMRGGAPVNSQRPFTDRETSVLRYLVEGLSNKEIAERLETTEAAIKACIQRLFDKTGARSRGHLIRITLENYHGYL